MKMKQFLVIATSLLLVASLGSCRRGGKTTSVQPSGTSDQPTSQTSITPSSSGKTSTSQPSQHTPESIIQDFVKAYFEQETAEIDVDYEYDEDYEVYVTGSYSGSEYAEESYLESFLEEIVSCFPSYMVVDQDPTEQEDEYGVYWDTVYYTSDSSIYIYAYDYVYDTTYGIVASIEVGYAS